MARTELRSRHPRVPGNRPISHPYGVSPGCSSFTPPVTTSPISALTAWRLAVRARNKIFTMAVCRSFASWGSGSSISLPIRVEGEQTISVGRQTVFREGCWLQTTDEGVIEIGDDCHFSGYTVISAAQSIIVESHVLFARNVHILDHNHRTDLDVPIRFQGETAAQPIRIREGSWIGANVVICPGVTVGRGAVVAANSIVRDDVTDRVVVAGAPAREICRIGTASSPALT